MGGKTMHPMVVSTKAWRFACLIILVLALASDAWMLGSTIPSRANRNADTTTCIPTTTTTTTTIPKGNHQRRQVLQSLSSFTAAFLLLPTQPASAYTPDPDPLRESLYFISRVQEATVQQERFVSKANQQQEALQAKMKLTLRLVDKNYRLLDQINYCSTFVTPKDAVVEATQAGYEAVDALQGAIDYVKSDANWKTGPLTDSQQAFLQDSMQTCRAELFVFLQYMPLEALAAARKRVETENVANRDEFDGDENAGVYNPVILPWKQPQQQQQQQQSSSS